MTGREAPNIFNRRLVRLRRTRSAKSFAQFDFLHKRAIADIIDRLETIKRDFPRAVFAGAGHLTKELTPACGVGELFQCDLSQERLPMQKGVFCMDEAANALAPQSINLFVSVLTLHTVNDVVGALAQARAALKPDGLFIAAVFAEETLNVIRTALYSAEAEILGGVSARISPFATIQDLGNALARAGFALPVTDLDKFDVTYERPASLIRDLRGIGETNALSNRSLPMRRNVYDRAMEKFSAYGGQERFEIAYLTGWAPHESQQKPLKPGSATARLSDAVMKNTR